MRIQVFQWYVMRWMREVFEGACDLTTPVLRGFRFTEEAIELAQAVGMTKCEARRVVDYVFARPIGSVPNEVGGVMVTLAALCGVLEVDLSTAAYDEFRRIDTPDLKRRIRDKQAFKESSGLSRDPVTANNGDEAEALFQSLRHGDEDHQAWLREAIAAYYSGAPVPSPRGSGRKQALIDQSLAVLRDPNATPGDKVLRCIPLLESY
jgi:NTP pyrophosphatase (non-canonical NTP hydrolase)